MEKRLILAIGLSLLILISWSSFMAKISPPSKSLPSEKIILTPSAPLKQAQEPELPSTSLFNFSDDKFEITFIEPQAAIKEVTFKAHQNDKFPLKYGFLYGDQSLLFQKQSIAKEGVTFTYRDPEKEITKRFILSKPNYTIELEIEIHNVSIAPLKVNLPLVLGVLNFVPDPKQPTRFQDVAVATKDKTLHLNARKEMWFPEVKFLGLRDRYFCSILEPASDNYQGFIKKINPFESEIGLIPKEFLLSAGEQLKQKFHIYLGPQDLRLINRVKPDWSAVVYYGAFDFIAQIILQLLQFLYGLVHNWGWAIVIFSLVIYLLLFPLTLKQMRSIKQMQALQPHIEELRKMYKDNPQKLNKEMMVLYREHKVNPLGGCLPMILQMPIFIALWQVFQRSILLKGAGFLWIKDLSEPDRLFTFTGLSPLKEINILPILTAILMFIQQKISMVPASSGSAEQQKIMLIMMPLIFGFAFYRMPAGWVLYFFIYTLLALIYQSRLSRTTK